MTRYDDLPTLINMILPATIVEVGTHKATRATLMCQTALAHRYQVHYIGYDLFDEATPETNAEEMNGKGPANWDAARARLNMVKDHHHGFTFELIKGNTRKTLHGKDVVADFVFIDGGHSVETIRGDYEALKNSRMIVFDDFYVSGVDTTKFGCNSIVADMPHAVLKKEDPIIGGGKVRMAMRSL